MNINNPTTFGTPSLTLSTSNSSGTGGALRADDTILVYDTTAVDAITFGQSGSVGSASTASRRDHAHAMAANPLQATLIGTAVADDSSSLTVTGLDSTYDVYMIGISDIDPVSDGQPLYLRVGDSSGVDAGATDYAYAGQRLTEDVDTFVPINSTGAAQIPVADNLGNATGEGAGAVFWLTRPGDGSTFPTLHGSSSAINQSGLNQGIDIRGIRQAVITLDRISILMASGNITAGRLTVWGFIHA